MRAGTLDERVELQERVETKDNDGYESESWRTVARVWVSVENLKAEERIEAEQRRGTRTHRIRMRYRAGVTSKMRIRDGDVVYQIDAVTEGFGRRRELQLMAVREE